MKNENGSRLLDKEEKTKTTKKRNLVEVSRLLIGLLIVVVIGTTYAMIVYENDLTSNSSLVAGDIYMHYNETNQLTLENAMPSEGPDESKYFEFTISGKNTYKQKDIWYEIQLNRGDKHETRTTRIRDDLLKFRLVEIKDGQETVVVDNQNYASLIKRRIYVNTISKDTTDEVNITYRLYMWIDNNTIIGNTSDVDYDIDTWNNDVYGSVKITVKGNLEEKNLNNRGNFVDIIKSKYGSDTTLIAVNTEGDLYDVTNTDQEVREYRYSGPTANNYVFFDTNGDGVKDTNEIWRVVGVFKDTVKDEDGNVVNDASGNPTYEEEVKLVRNTILTADELPESYLINGTTYTIAYSTTSNYAYWNYVPSGTYPSTNKNDWTTAGLQYYLNTEKDETDTSDGTTTANAGYLSLLTNEAKELISPTTYYLGSVKYGSSGDTPKSAYVSERTETQIWSGNQATWDGLIGMMYPSDYGYSASDLYWETDMYGWSSAESDGVKVRSTSWFYQTANHSHGTHEWLLSPSSNSSNGAMTWPSTGSVNSGGVNDYRGVRPVLNLKSQAKVIYGAGTSEDPFEIVAE